jgi:hypothetical protein
MFILRILLLVFYLVLPISIFAQVDSTTGELVGLVKDSQGKVIGGANITVLQEKTNLNRTTVTDEEGKFLLLKLSPSVYKVTVFAEGFNEAKDQVLLSVGKSTLLEVVLVPAGSNDVIEITASNNINRLEGSTNINRKRIVSLPIGRRSFLDFALTAPGFVSDQQLARTITISSGFSISGQSGRTNNITVDGLDNNDRFLGSVKNIFGQDSIQEFQVVADSFSAEFGRALGGITNVVTRTGSNQFTNDIFFLYSNDKINARDPFIVAKLPFSRYQFGSSLSGALKKDKSFLFLSFERLSLDKKRLITINQRVLDSLNRQNFPSRGGVVSAPESATYLSGRLDNNLTENSSLWVRYNFGGTFKADGENFGFNELETYGGASRIKDNAIASSYTYLNPKYNFVNEFRFLYSYRDQATLSPDDTVQLRISNGNSSNENDEATYGTFARLPQLYKQSTYQFVDNFSLVKGKNQIKFGVDFEYVDVPARKTEIPFFNSGVAIFSELNLSSISGIPSLPSLSGLEAFDPSLRNEAQTNVLKFFSGVLPGAVSGFPKGVALNKISLPLVYIQSFINPNVGTTGKFFSFYAQDELKAKDNLLIKVGVRYDLNQLARVPNNNGNFSPRIAISYRPRSLEKLNFRLGYGLFFGLPLISPALDVELSKKATVVVLSFPFSVLPFTLPEKRFPKSENPPAGIPITPQLAATFQYQPNLRNSYSQQVVTGIDYFFNKDSVFSMNYTYVKGIKLLSLRNINPVIRPIANDSLGSQITGRIFPDQGAVFEFGSSFDSYYHGLTLSAERRFTEKFGVLVNYIFSKTIDTSTNVVSISSDQLSDPLNPKLDRALASFDQRHRFYLSGLFSLPDKKFFSGMALSTILRINSALPYNLIANEDLNMNGDFFEPSDRPNGIGRNAGIQKSFAALDLRITKNIIIKGRNKIELFVEGFNVLNRSNIGLLLNQVIPKDSKGNFILPPQKNGRFVLENGGTPFSSTQRRLQFGFRHTFN